MSKTIVLIPAYNEETNILSVCRSLEKYPDIDYVVINDSSLDKTKLVCEENNLNCINLIHNLGIGGAMQTGYIYAREQNYDIAVQFDGDGQHNAKYINDLVNIIKNNNVDLCIGSRFVKSDEEGFKSTRARRLGIKLISSLIKLVTGQRIWDPTSGFRACNRKVVEVFSKSYPSEFPEPESSVRLINAGFSVKESPVQMKDRQGGVSSIRTWRNLYYMINVCLSILVESIRKNAN